MRWTLPDQPLLERSESGQGRVGRVQRGHRHPDARELPGLLRRKWGRSFVITVLDQFHDLRKN
jgi:hypothetical protein